MTKVKIKAADQTDLLVTRNYLNEGALIIPDSLTTVKDNQAVIQILNISATNQTLPENILLIHYDFMQQAVQSVYSLDKMQDKTQQGRKINPYEVNCAIEGRSERITHILNKYRSTCKKEGEKVEPARVEPMRINTGNSVPVHQRQYTTPFALKDSLREQIKVMKEAGVIRESRSPWNSPIFLIKKKDQGFLPVIDFRDLNQLRSLESFPLPVISDLFNSLNEAKYFFFN